MRLWRKSQQEPVEAAPVEPAESQVEPAQSQVEPAPASGGEQGEPFRGPDPRLPGSAGYGTGYLPKGRKRHMPGARFTFVRPDSLE